MSDLNERLDRALSAIEPGPAPVRAAMERGRKIRTRRRAATLAGSVAVIAAVGAGVPVLTHPQALPGPSAAHIRVTVNPPGPHSPAGTIASGLVGMTPWNVRVESPDARNCVVTGTGLAIDACARAVAPPGAADPIGFGATVSTGTADGGGPDELAVTYGQVRKDVTSVRVRLADGTVLTPRPVTLGGTGWLAFATPVSVPVTRLTAYSRTGEIATAIPFDGPRGDSNAYFGAWQRPGEAGAPRVTTRFASGTFAGQAWALTAYTGPWGFCVVGGDGSNCRSATPAPLSRGIAPQGGTGVGTSGSLVWGIAADAVSYLIVTPKGGTAMRVEAVLVGRQKYFGLSLGHEPEKADRWTAYGSAGQPIDSGTLRLWGS